MSDVGVELLRSDLERALDRSQDGEVNYHIRSALQQVDAAQEVR